MHRVRAEPPGTYATAQNRGLTAGSTAAAPASYGTQPGAPSNYGNDSYGAAPGAAAGASTSQPYGGAGTSQGFYSPDYRGAAGSTGADQPLRRGRPIRLGRRAGRQRIRTARMARAAMRDRLSPVRLRAKAAPRHPLLTVRPRTPTARRQLPQLPTAITITVATAAPIAMRLAAARTVAEPPAAVSTVRLGPMPERCPRPRRCLPPAVAAGGYRPGSTARNTQFGTSDNLNVPGGESVQPASFAGGSQGSGSSLYAPGPVGSNGSYPTSEVSPTQDGHGSRQQLSEHLPTVSRQEMRIATRADGPRCSFLACKVNRRHFGIRVARAVSPFAAMARKSPLESSGLLRTDTGFLKLSDLFRAFSASVASIGRAPHS